MSDDAVRHAPFTDRQVESFNAYQFEGTFHPFTCPRSHTFVSESEDEMLRELREDEDTYPFHFEHVRLVAFRDGLRCPAQDCDYRQAWAWVFMLNESWKRARDEMGA